MFHDDPSRMTADERTDEVAALLAAGFLRLKRRTCLLPGDDPAHVSTEESPEKRPELAGGVPHASASCPAR